MKRDSKMSVLRIVVATLVGVLCFVQMSFADIHMYVYNAWNCGISQGNQSSIIEPCGEGGFFKIPGNGGVYFILYDDSNKDLNVVSSSGLGNESPWNDKITGTNIQWTGYYLNPATAGTYVKIEKSGSGYKLSVINTKPDCGPVVGNIPKTAGTRICLGATALAEPSNAGSFGTGYTKGWEIVETGEKFVSLGGSISNNVNSQYLVDAAGNKHLLSEFYGKNIRYYVTNASGTTGYSNSVLLANYPVVTLENGKYYCANMSVKDSDFPSIVTLNANGLPLTSSQWSIYDNAASAYVPYVSQELSADLYGRFFYSAENQCGTTNSKYATAMGSSPFVSYKLYPVESAPTVEDMATGNGGYIVLPDFEGEIKQSSSTEWTSFTEEQKYGPFSCGSSSYNYDVRSYDEHGCVSETKHFTVHMAAGITKEENVADFIACANDLKKMAVVASACNGDILYQWYKNGVAISGATTDSYIPTESGEYYCEVKSTSNTAYVARSSKANVTVVQPATVSFVSTMPSDIFCTQTIPAELRVENNGVDITSSCKRFFWTKNDNIALLSSSNKYSYSFDCDKDNGNFELSAYINDPNGCVAEAEKQIVSVNNSYKTYYYCGPTGISSDLTNSRNWCTSKTGTAGSCESPSNFTTDHCKYIINKDGVELLSNQTWTVSGDGSKVVVGDGTWNVISGATRIKPDGVDAASANNYDIVGYYEMLKSCTNEEWNEYLTNVASADYRRASKKLTISGTFNTGDGVVVDVKNGSSLTITTENGSFKLGEISSDMFGRTAPNKNEDGVINGYSWAAISPGASVTYTGNGVKNIRSGSYSQLYIEVVNESDVVSIEKDAIIDIKQAFKTKYATKINIPKNNIKSNGSTFNYCGSVNQVVQQFNYDYLNLTNSSKKTIENTIYANKSFVVGASTTLNHNGTLYLYGENDDAFINKGHVVCSSTSDVYYFASTTATVAPVYYGNLHLSYGTKVMSKEGVIGVSGALSLENNASCVTTGSIVEFNGSMEQKIPGIEFHNLVINNKGLDGSASNQVLLDGNVTVKNQLSLVEGILNTNGKSLNITNSAADAIGQGYRVNDDSASFVIGNITRSLPSNSTNLSNTYLYPLGMKNGDSFVYMPLTMQGITTGGDASVIVGIEKSLTNSYNSPLTGIKTQGGWKIEGNNYESSSVSVSTSAGLNGANTLAFKEQGTTKYNNVVGCSVSSDAICASSMVEGDGIVALATRTINEKTYYFNCNSTSSDPTSTISWWTGKYAVGSHPTSFEEDDATWIFDCGTTIGKDLAIGGSNTRVVFNIKSGDVLTIDADVNFPIVDHQQGFVNVSKNGTLSIMNSFTMRDVHNTSNKGNRTTIKNDGVLNIYNSSLNLTDSYILNNGTINMTNVDISMESGAMWSGTMENNDRNNHARFVNNGIVKMYNGALTVKGGTAWATNLRNNEGAVWLIDNTATPYKKVVFSGVEFWKTNATNPVVGDVRYVYFECGSSFMVKGSDVDVNYTGNDNGCHAYLEGELVVYDGNLTVQRASSGGGNFTVKECGSIHLVDTDNSGDGVFEVDGSSGWQVNVEGSLYAEGIVNKSNGSGNKFNVNDGAEIFVGDIGVTSTGTFSWDFSLDVQKGAVMNYCGNRSSGSDAIGKNEGTLNYAGSFYENSSPIEQGDVGGKGNQNVMYVDGTDCMAAYKEAAYNNNGSTLLPIELTMIYGICKENVVELHWQTVSETGNEIFEVLRSFDGVNFEEIGSLLGAGTTTEVQNYVYFDTDEDKTGIVYYKLRQVDFDKKSVESKIIAVQTCGKNAQISVAPDEIFVQFKNPETANYVVITTLSGQIIYSKTFNNVDEARIAAPRTKGIYIISVIDNKQITSEKFIK